MTAAGEEEAGPVIPVRFSITEYPTSQSVIDAVEKGGDAIIKWSSGEKAAATARRDAWGRNFDANNRALKTLLQVYCYTRLTGKWDTNKQDMAKKISYMAGVGKKDVNLPGGELTAVLKGKLYLAVTKNGGWFAAAKLVCDEERP